MPKRTAEEKINYYNEKIRKLQAKTRKRSNRILSSSPEPESIANDGLQCEDEKLCKTPEIPPDDLIADLMPDEPQHSSSVADALEEPELDPQLLDALGDTCDETPVYGPNIHNNLAKRWLPILKKGLQGDIKEKLLKEYNIPDNCRLLKAPTLNAEIFAAVNDLIRNRDKKLQVKQDQLGSGIAAINKALTLLLTEDNKIECIKILSDGCRILTDLHYTETQVRTKLVTPGLDKAFLSIIQNQERDGTLFGETLPEKIKASRAIERQGLQIKKVHSARVPMTNTMTVTRGSNQGNWAAPPRYPPPRRGGHTTSYRTAAHQFRRTPQTPGPAQPKRLPANSNVNKRVPARQ